MLCPVCDDVDMKQTLKEGIEIDYCPNCKGVWLDRGELDKIIERSETDNEMLEHPVGETKKSTRGKTAKRGGKEENLEDKPIRGFSDVTPEQVNENTFGSSNEDTPGKKDYPRFDQDYFKRNKRPSFIRSLFDFTER